MPPHILSDAHLARALPGRLAAFLSLCKPRVNNLIVFTALIGMALAVPPDAPWSGALGLRVLWATLGIALVAGAAAAMNCLIEQQIDARMARTRQRPLPRGLVDTREALLLVVLVGGLGLATLGWGVNPLTMWLTLGTFLGYTVVYTVLLKPITPMNIVIGGASGAMPPVLGWAALRGAIGAEALALFLIIFIWTPVHFWALALYRREEYAQAGLPMLPVTHGIELTCLHMLLYTVMLVAASFIPVSLGMMGWSYALGAAILGGIYLVYGLALWRRYSDGLARRSFRFSIVYLFGLFALLLFDHFRLERILFHFLTA